MDQERMPQGEKSPRLSGHVRRQLILRRAKEEFARHSYAGASTGLLARASGVTEPMLYKHFGSKKGLFLAVLEQYIAAFFDDWQQRIAQQARADILAALSDLPRTYAEAVAADRDVPRLILQAIAASADDPEFDIAVYRYQRRVYEVIHSLLMQARAAGLIDATVDLDAATWFYSSTVLAIQFSQMIQPPQGADWQKIEEWGRTRGARMVHEAGQLWLRALRPPTG